MIQHQLVMMYKKRERIVKELNRLNKLQQDIRAVLVDMSLLDKPMLQRLEGFNRHVIVWEDMMDNGSRRHVKRSEKIQRQIRDMKKYV